LSRAVSDFRAEIGGRLDPAPATDDRPAPRPDGALAAQPTNVDAGSGQPADGGGGSSRPDPVDEQIVSYFADGHRVLGVIPTQQTLVLERFFDESGGMQLVLHAPFGSRINRAWALALRKRFCRQFNFELQAAATEDGLLLSLGPQHSFPLADVFRYLHPATVRDILVQAFLDAPVFQARWRWNATISLAVPRNRNGRKVPPQLQRMQADDLMAAVFPDAAACQDNLPGDREIPNHPLVNQAIRDCLEEAMDINGLIDVLSRIHRGELRLVSRDTPEPSVFAHEILNARPYAFLDDAPLEERRARAVQMRRAGESDADDLGALDIAAIERVRDEARLEPRDVDELHDALLTAGFLPQSGGSENPPYEATAGRFEDPPHEETARGSEDPAYETSRAFSVVNDAFETLAAAGRATRVLVGRALGPAAEPLIGPAVLWVCAERLPEMLTVHPHAALDPRIEAPPARAARAWTREEAIVELLRGRLAIVGPATAAALAASLAITESDADLALLALESEGVVLRGTFTPGVRAVEWCDRRLLARIHRYTLNRLRAEISPVSPADFMRFLFAWQHVASADKLTAIEGLRAVLAQLDGMELPARAWERAVLPSRLDRYEPAMLDMLCLTGEVAWARLSTGPTPVVGATPIALFLRQHANAWLALRETVRLKPAPAYDTVRLKPDSTDNSETASTDVVSRFSRTVLEHLRTRGASFAHEIAASCNLSEDDCRTAVTGLVAAGAISSDGFAGLRALVGESRGAGSAGRWSLIHAADGASREKAIELLAWTLLRRYGVMFRRLLAREATDVPWRELARVYRRLEARGEIRGGRFVSGMSGEQFALPDAVERLREIRRSPPDDRLITISAADPLNLTGIVTAGAPSAPLGAGRIRAATASRIVFRNGVPLAAREGDMLRTLTDVDPEIAADVAAAAAGRRVPVLSGYVGRI
jgi:ATP-dependent Lhr-like helicase